MNGRFVELAYQAKLFDGTGSVPFNDVAKFAELIVRECADVADNPDVDMLRIGKAIKEHFGVLE